MNTKIQAIIDNFVSELTHALTEASHEAISNLLGDRSGGGGGRPGKRGPKAKAIAIGKRGRRSAEELEALGYQIIAYIKNNPEQRAEQIASGLGVTTKELTRPVTLLLEQKALKKAGQRRGTTYTAR